MENKDFFEAHGSDTDEKTRDAEEVVEKSGDRRKSALMIAGGALLGAFIGDTFYGHEVKVAYDGELPGYPGWAAHTEYYGRDYGGLADLVHKDSTPSNDLEKLIATQFGGDNDKLYQEPLSSVVINGKRVFMDYGPAQVDLFDIHGSLPLDGAVYGGSAGLVTGLGADFIRKRRQNK